MKSVALSPINQVHVYLHVYMFEMVETWVMLLWRFVCEWGEPLYDSYLHRIDVM